MDQEHLSTHGQLDLENPQLTWVLTVFLIINALVSAVAMYRWSQRVNGVEPSNTFWEFVDERFPNERMERIYANMEFSTKK